MQRLASNDRIAARLSLRLAPIFDAPAAPAPAPTTGAIPMQYDELLAEIARAVMWLDAHPAPSTNRVTVELRRSQLVSARDAWDAHVAGNTPCPGGCEGERHPYGDNDDPCVICGGHSLTVEA